MFCLFVRFNNRDSLQIAILPCIFSNPPNITLITPFKLYSCSKSFSNVTIDHGSQFQPPRVLRRRLGPLRFHCGIDSSGTRLTLTTTLVAREDQKHLKALKRHLCILPRSDVSPWLAIKGGRAKVSDSAKPSGGLIRSGIAGFLLVIAEYSRKDYNMTWTVKIIESIQTNICMWLLKHVQDKRALMLTVLSQLGTLGFWVKQSPKCAARQGVKRRQSLPESDPTQ